MKTFICLLLLAGIALSQDYFLDDINFSRVVCLNDSLGRQVQIGGRDTSVVLKGVVWIVLMNSSFQVRFKNKREAIFPIPPFKRAFVQ